jgi:pyruvate,water dikinase
MNSSENYIRFFKEINLEDVEVFGGKTASLGEMYQRLGAQGIRVPNGFGIMAAAYRLFLSDNNLDKMIKNTLETCDISNSTDLAKAGKKIREAIVNAELPAILRSQISDAYLKLEENQDGVAIRSSATAEDLPGASFAGQQETYLNVSGEKELLNTCKKCFASLFTDRAISYREDKKFGQNDIALSICVQKMVRSDLAASGVMFSLDTETGFKDAVLINSSYGLGENIVQGSVTPDEFYVFKGTLFEGKRPIISKKLGSKEYKLIYDKGGSKMVKNIPVVPVDRKKFSLSEDEILCLAKWACIIEEYYSKWHQHYTPMDIEWAKDGITGELFIVQARPETIHSQEDKTKFSKFFLKETGNLLASACAVGDTIATGKVRIIKNTSQLADLQEGEILVTDKTDPDWEPTMKRAAGIITNHGGRTCHAAIVSRELGVPAVVGVGNATEILSDGMMITLSCAEGEVGKIYEGKLDYDKELVNVDELSIRPNTAIMLNLANPDIAFSLSRLPNDGVGLARMEFIINHAIKIHPLALIHYNEIKDLKTKSLIGKMTEGYPEKTDYFVDKLSQGIAMIAAAFYPNDVIVRFSDFKSNEYAHLLGGAEFEPDEANPMIGFRGASRYYHPLYRDGFALECKALKKVREEMGLTNVKVMVPFCRTIDEGKKVLAEMEKNNFSRGNNGLEVYVMCEIPSNVILAEDFAKIFDGFSIGSNDLTQLVLGVDRDSEILSDIFDERDPAVKTMISDVIRIAKKNACKIGICGQGPSDYPDFAAYLVREGIDSMSLNPDSLIKTTAMIKDIEENPLS